MRIVTFFLFTGFVLLNGFRVLHAQNVGIGTTAPSDKLTVETDNNSYGITHRSVQGNILSTRIGGSTAGIGTFSPTDMRIYSGGLSRIIISQASGEVFIGTDDVTVGNKLTVRTSNNSYGITHLGDNGNILSTRMGGSTAGIGTFSATDMRIFSGGISRMIINQATGEVSIGTDDLTPGNKLFVRTASGSYGITHSDGSIVLSSYLGGSQPYAYIGTQSNHALSFYTNNSASQMTLSTEGNVGIGTAPTSGVRMHINDDGESIRLSGSQPYINFFNGVDYKGLIGITSVNDITLGTIGSNANGKLNFNTLGTTRMSIYNNGQVSVNGPPAPNGSPAFTVNGNGVLSLISDVSEWTIVPETCFNPGGPCLFFLADGFSRAKIDAAGDWVALSDKNVKDGVKNYKPVLQNIKNLDVVTYHYKHNNSSDRSFGLIAQNVAEYFPEIVQKMSCKSGQDLFGIAYSKVGVLAIKAIQEQQVIIEQQQVKIESLEKRLAALEKLLLKN